MTDQPPPPDQDGLEDYFTDVEHLRDLLRRPRLHPNILLVISGRAVPGWGRQWPEWMAQAEVHELAPMSAAVMRELNRATTPRCPAARPTRPRSRRSWPSRSVAEILRFAQNDKWRDPGVRQPPYSGRRRSRARRWRLPA
jgi:hypothetical protein